MKRCALLLAATCLVAALPAAAEEEEAPYGALWVGPRVGGGLGINGPRGGYFAGLELRYDSPLYFTYALEVGFLHLLPHTIAVPQTADESGTVVAPEHDVRLKGLFGVPITLEIGLRVPVGRARLRAGVGIGAMFTTQIVEGSKEDDRESIGSFCFRPTVGLDVPIGRQSGLVRFDVAYLWQQAEFDQTGSNHDVDTVLLTIGYSWRLYP